MNRNELAPAVRKRLRRLPAPQEAHYGVLPLSPTEAAIDIGSARASHHRAMEMLGRIDAIAAELHDPYVISRTLSRREAVSSSSIEGTNSTLDELLSIEEEDEGARDEARQVRDYAVTLDRFLPRAAETGPDIFTVGLICELHAEAMRSDPDYPDAPGEIRTIVNWIGGMNIATSTYNPPPPADVPDCLGDTARYMRIEGMQAMTQSLITRIALAHAHFEAVHPFRDGNGRVGRLLIPMMMAADGRAPLYISPYIEANKAAYYAGLKAAQQRLEWAPLIGFLSDAITGSVEELVATRGALKALREDWRLRRRFRTNSAALRMLDILPDYPVTTASRMAGRLGLSMPATLTGISQLVDAGILRERTGYRRNRIFSAPEVLRLLNRPFGTEPARPGAA